MQNKTFLSNCKQIDNIKQSLMLTKSLYVASLIVGQKNTGKKTFIASLLSDYIFIDAKDKSILQKLISKNKQIVIYNFEYITNTDNIDFNNKKIIAIANTSSNTQQLKDKFAFVHNMPNLEQRQIDIEVLSSYYLEIVKNTLMIDKEIKLDISSLDISKNNKSLKADIYKKVLTSNLEQIDVENILFNYLYKNINHKNGYKDNLGIFEKPLIKAGLKKYRSASKLSIALGINRNTLRKKTNEYDIN